jgi:hypothetical protein
VQATVQFAIAILAEAALSYLGLGTQPPDASWGRMLNEAQTFMEISPHFSSLKDAAKSALIPLSKRRKNFSSLGKREVGRNFGGGIYEGYFKKLN